jgi:hypothetical protein
MSTFGRTVAAVGVPNSTARVRTCRARAEAGKLRVANWLDLERVRELLLGADMLKAWDQEDKKVIRTVFWQAVELWMTEEERKQALSNKITRNCM